MLTFGSLFSGIGGLDLGLERAGWTCRWQVEIDDFCRRVLAKHWPCVPRYTDVRGFPGGDVEPVDLICGGFPCQPVSIAGKRLASDDERWLWPEFARVVRALRPRYVFVENVPGLLIRGFGDVLRDLAESGFDAEWDCVPASALGAPHRRDRVWLVGYRRELGPPRPVPDAERDHLRDERQRDEAPEWADGRATIARAHGALGHMADADGGRRETVGLEEPSGLASAHGRVADRRGGVREQHDAPAPDAQRDRLEGIFAPWSAAGPTFGDGRWWQVESDVGRVANGVPGRVDRLRALGNAVVPQVAEWIGTRIAMMAGR